MYAIDQRRVARPGKVRSAADAAVGSPVAMRCLANHPLMMPSEVNTVHIPLQLVRIWDCSVFSSILFLDVIHGWSLGEGGGGGVTGVGLLGYRAVVLLPRGQVPKSENQRIYTLVMLIPLALRILKLNRLHTK